MPKASNYVIQPKGKALYEDESSFGSKMLAKMGWTKGKGLGAKEDGAQDFIRVRYKNDAGGLGYAARDDHWTENESNFNSLLENLNQNTDVNVQDVIKKESLEEKSKKSKAKVHYQKFTRGKDISRYSEKDLANIFGKKTLGESYRIETESNSKDNSNEASQGADSKEDYGTKIINTGVSIVDYFKSKRNKSKNEVVEPVEVDAAPVEVDETPINVEVGESAKKESKKRKKRKSSIESLIAENNAACEQPAEEETIENPKKKQKKVKEVLEQPPVSIEVDSCTDETKSKKKNKKEIEDSPVEAVSTEKIKKKSKKDKKLDNSNEEATEVNETEKIDSKPEKLELPRQEPSPAQIEDLNKFFLNSIAAEKLKHLKLEKFKQSNLANIVGYGLTRDLKLEVRDSSIIKGSNFVNKYTIYANVDKMHSKKYHKSLLLRFHKKRNTFKI